MTRVITIGRAQDIHQPLAGREPLAVIAEERVKGKNRGITLSYLQAPCLSGTKCASIEETTRLSKDLLLKI